MGLGGIGRIPGGKLGILGGILGIPGGILGIPGGIGGIPGRTPALIVRHKIPKVGHTIIIIIPGSTYLNTRPQIHWELKS